MHFNRTQFAAKTQTRLFALAILILVFLLSSCSIGDLGDLDDLGHAFDGMFSSAFKGPSSSGIYIFPGGNSPTLSLDSILYDSTSIYKVCSSIQFDSTIVLTGFTFNYLETNDLNASSEIKQAVVDTIDFRVSGPYVHKIRITEIEPTTEYRICAMASYLMGKDTMLIASPCVTFRTP
jgi:hypothetical protein